MSYPDLAGRAAIVTGAGRGLGRAMALGLVRRGSMSSRRPRGSAKRSRPSPKRRRGRRGASSRSSPI